MKIPARKQNRLAGYDYRWQRSFHDSIVRNKRSLISINQYINDNSTEGRPIVNNRGAAIQMQTHRIMLVIMAVAILCPCCYGASNLPPRIEGDLAVFFNGKLLDPQHTGFLTSCNFYLPVQIGHRLFEDPIHLDYDGVYVYPVHFETYEEEVDRRLSELEAETTNTQRLLDGLQAASFTNGPYKVDLTYALLGQFALFATEDRTGCPVAGDQEGDISTCFEEFLDGIDRVTQGVILYVRGCEPVPVGLILRALQKRKIKVSLYYLDTNAPLKYSISRKKKDEQQRP